MSNVIARVLWALEEAKVTLRERCPFGDAEATVDAALAELRRYEVVEGCAVDEGGMMVYYDFPAEGSDETPAILLVQKEQP
jgi:hypothetical protein